MPTRRQPRFGYSLVEVIVVVAILALLLGLTLPAVQKVRGTSARAVCANHLRQQGIALANHHAALGSLPNGKTPHRSTSHPDMAWLTRLLPYIEQDALWRQAEAAYRAQPNWYDQPSVHPMATVVRAYTCPADDRLRQANMARKKFLVASTSYIGVSGTTTRRKNGTFFSNSAVKFTDMTDGTSNTIVIGERPPSVDFWFGWWYAGYGADGGGKGDMLLGTNDGGGGFDQYVLGCEPVGFVPGDFTKHCHSLHFWSLHPGGANFAFGDGSVRFLKYTAANILPALATRAGGESTPLPD